MDKDNAIEVKNIIYAQGVVILTEHIIKVIVL